MAVGSEGGSTFRGKLRETFSLFQKLFVAFPRSSLDFFLSLRVKGLAALAIFFSSIAVAYVFKFPIHSIFVGNNESWPEIFAHAARFCGDGGSVLIVGMTLLVLGMSLDRREMLDAFAALLAAALWCGGVTMLGQFVFAEARPDSGGAMAFFKLHGHGVSGHASSAAVLFWPIYSTVGKKLERVGRSILGAALLSWATLVSWSRMWDDKHFLWNVLCGAAIGLVVGYIVTRELEKIRPDR